MSIQDQMRVGCIVCASSMCKNPSSPSPAPARPPSTPNRLTFAVNCHIRPHSLDNPDDLPPSRLPLKFRLNHVEYVSPNKTIVPSFLAVAKKTV